MMEKNDKKTDVSDNYDYLKATSAWDCTGLIPSGIQDYEELEHYEELYPFLPTAVRPDDLSSEPE